MFSRIDVVAIVMVSAVRAPLVVVVAEDVAEPEDRADANALLPSNLKPKGVALQRLFSLVECSRYVLRLALSIDVVDLFLGF